MGKIGGAVKSKAKAAAVRENGKRGGRPRLSPPCSHYPDKSHRYSPKTGLCTCGFNRLGF
jgi:hypothetical protein